MSVPQEDIRRQAFPVFDQAQIEALRPFAVEEPTTVGEVLFEVGDASYPLVVVLAGRMQVVERSERANRVLKESGPGEFIGELGMLTGQRAIAACVVVEAGQVLLASAAGVQEAIRTVPELSDLLVTAFAARRQLLMRSASATLTIVGRNNSAPVATLKEFLDRNRVPHRFIARDDPAVTAVLAPFGYPPPAETLVVIQGVRLLEDPTLLDVARALGLDLVFDQAEPADLLVVGTGPAGLAAAVYGASEGLKTIAIDDVAIGGQAGTSSRIENYLGFPTGISGGDLAFRGEVQAIKFGARITVPRRATGLQKRAGCFVIGLEDGGELLGRSVVIATGARYRRLGLPNQGRFEGAGIYYAATDLEARVCGGNEVVVVGGGNSAGQATMFLSRHARIVHHVYRGSGLKASMSDYLIARLKRVPNVKLWFGTNVVALHGNESLEGVTLKGPQGDKIDIPAKAVFAMIGAEPCSGWLEHTLALDAKGFILTGSEVGGSRTFEASEPGVFAVGDIRAGSVKRVASAVGEGSVVIQAVHRYIEATQADTIETAAGQEPIVATG